MNLVSNAIKFTPPGGTVHLTVEETAATDLQAVYLFKVTDTGIGIRAEDLERIFESFVPAPTECAVREPGWACRSAKILCSLWAALYE